MTCDEAEILLHALIDGELDAGHAREVEQHVAGCPRCAAALADYRADEPGGCRRRSALHRPACLARTHRGLAAAAAIGEVGRCRAGARCCAALRWDRRYRRSPRPASFAIVLRNDDEQRIESEVVSAHLRSLQAGHLIDVVSTDQHTVKPWFNGKLDVSPPVIDLTAQGFTLIGGRLDYLDARAIGAVVYKRRAAHHQPVRGADRATPSARRRRWKPCRASTSARWSEQGMNYWAVSDIGADELTEFGEKFEAAVQNSKEG